MKATQFSKNVSILTFGMQRERKEPPKGYLRGLKLCYILPIPSY